MLYTAKQAYDAVIERKIKIENNNFAFIQTSIMNAIRNTLTEVDIPIQYFSQDSLLRLEEAGYKLIKVYDTDDKIFQIIIRWGHAYD